MRKDPLFRIAALGALLLSAAACVFPYPVETSQDGDRPLVIEGDIHIGGKTTLTLSHVRPFKKEATSSFSRFAVEGYIEGEDGTRVEGQSLPRETEERRIVFDTEQLSGSQRYRLHLETATGNSGKKEVIESDWLEVTQAPVIDGLSYSHHPEYEELWIGLSMHCQDAHHFRWAFSEEWEYHSDDLSTLQFNPKNGLVIDYAEPIRYYCWASRNSGKINIFSTANQTDDRFEDLAFHTIPLTDLRLQTLYRLTVRLSAMSENAYNYWNNMQQNSEGQGSLFATTPSEMESNLHCLTTPSLLIIGYVTAAVEVSSRLVYDNSVNQYYIRPHPTKREEHLSPNDSLTNLGWLYKGYLPYLGDGNLLDSLITITWVPGDCVDCSRKGGSLTGPEDWPTNHRNFFPEGRD